MPKRRRQVTPDAEAAARRLAQYRLDPVLMVRDEFQAEPDPWQARALRLYPKTPRLALQACVGPGKSAVLVWIALNFLLTRPRVRIACTSITWPNLRDNLWSEFSKWISASEWASACVQWTQMAIKRRDDPEKCWISARTWDRSADPEQQAQTLSGLHEDYCMVIADETGAMPPTVLQAGEGVLSSATEAHIIQAGNPIDTSGALHEATVKQRHLWTVLRVTGDPDDPNRAPRVDIDWAREQIARYGRDSAFVRSKILGRYPLQSSDAILARADFEDAIGRTVNTATGDPLQHGFRVFGCDVARFGADKTVVCLRDGDFVDRFFEWQGKSVDYTVDRIVSLATEWRVEYIVVDDIGVGGGVTDGLKRKLYDGELSRSTRVKGINVGEGSDLRGTDDQPLYFNLRSELNLELAEKRFRKGNIGLTEEAARSPAIDQGSDLRYGFGRGGRVFQVESKDEYKKRTGGGSPDHWDALVLAFFPRQFISANYGWVA